MSYQMPAPGTYRRKRDGALTEAKTASCLCSDRVCTRHNRAHFYRRTGTGKPGSRKVRADVFRWDGRQYRTGPPVWTWCPVVKGEPVDDAWALGHYDSWELAYADAMAWVAGRYGSAREVAS